MVLDVELMKQRIAVAVEDQLPDPETPAHLGVERGGHFEHAAIEPERDIAVIDEQVGSHQLGQFGRIQMVAHVGEADRRRNAARPQRRGEQNRLGHAIVGRHARNMARTIFAVGGADLERIVADLVAHHFEQADRPLAVGQRLGPAQAARGEFPHLRRIAVDESRRLQQRVGICG
jgi:hypothetical protein